MTEKGCRVLFVFQVGVNHCWHNGFRFAVCFSCKCLHLGWETVCLSVLQNMLVLTPAINPTRWFYRSVFKEEEPIYEITWCWSLLWRKKVSYSWPVVYFFLVWWFLVKSWHTITNSNWQLRKQLALLLNVPQAQCCFSHAWQKAAFSKWWSRTTSGVYKASNPWCQVL